MHHLNMHQGQTMSFRGTARQPFCSSQALQPARKHIAHAHKQHQQQQQHTQHQLQQHEAAGQQEAPNHWRHLGSQGLNRIAVAAAAAALACAPMTVAPDAVLAATDTVKVGTCLLQKCQVQLAKCLGDPKCFQNIVCLNTCNDAPDEAGCQIRCGDLYGDAAVDTFNACAVSDQKCVPQRADEGVFPVPPDCALDKGFDLNGFTGRWYITAGLNPLFDTFDCQEHFFAVPEPGKMAGRINWRIPKPNGDFIERSVVQTFRQTDNPAILYNGNNEYLHYEDTWYILGYKPDSYVVIYYKGKNDAWDGYGGATVYTKARQLPQELVPELSAAVEGAGLKWSDFKVTDNSCKPHPPVKSLVQELEEDALKVEKGVEQDLEEGLQSFGRGFTVLEDEVKQLPLALREELRQAERVLEKVEQEVAIESGVLEDEVLTEVQGIEAAFSNLLSLFRK